MTETDERPPGEGPRVDPRQQFHHLDGLRRSGSDRYVAGVCGGLGRHFDIDPTLIRVLFAVTTLFAGAGVLLYVAIWLLVPEDGRTRSAINLRPELTRVLLIAAAVIGVLTLTGDAWGGFHRGWVLALVAFAGLAVLLGRERRTPYAGPAPAAPPSSGWTTSPDAAQDPGTSTTEEAPAAYDAGPPAAPVWQPPMAPPPPPRPRRTGLVLFFPTLALIAIGMGVLGLVDRTQDVPAAGYPALALAITGVMLVVGAFRGRPGGLILIGLVSTFALSVAGVVGSFHGGQTVNALPQNSAQVQDSYRITNGHLTVDLTGVSDVRALAGRTIEVSAQAAEVVIRVPRDLNVEADATLRFAGQIDLGDDSQGGVGGVHDSQSFVTGPQGEAPLVLDVHGRVGAITVEQE